MGFASRIKVGLFFNARREQGGLYQYALTLVDCLCRFAPEFDYSLYHAVLEPLPLELVGKNWRVIRLQARAIQVRLLEEALLMSAARAGLEIPFAVITEFAEIKQDHPEVVIYVKPGVHPFQWNYRAIFPIHDLQHRLQPQFPEVSRRGEYKRREFIYTHSIPRATAILTDSEVGKEDVKHCYQVDEKKIFSLPYIAPTFRSDQTSPSFLEYVTKKYALPSQYLFYPASFWTHKNHLRLIRSLGIIADEKKVRIPLVLAGGKRGDYSKVASLVSSLGLDDTVYFIGYVQDNDMPALYRQALALVMPTFFGPTNIPILEAWIAGCAVITSDIRGVREQVADAGLLVDPTSDRAIADAIWSLYQSPQTRSQLIERGKRRAVQWTPPDFARRLSEVIHYSVTQI
jgi:glycosyltransferase involved in cell wall biosynthesis